MRRLTSFILAALLCTAPATAQTYTAQPGAVADALTRPMTVLNTHILNGAWTTSSAYEPPSPGRLTMQTGAGETLTGTYDGKPCHGVYFESQFTLLCETSSRVPYLLTGRATRVQPQASAGVSARIVASPARIEARRTHLVTGLAPDGRSTSNFTATRD